MHKQSVRLLKGGIVSFTFDDFPESAFETGVKILESFNSKGVFFMAGGLEGKDTPVGRIITRKSLHALHNMGHEIGSHTYSHQRPFSQEPKTFLNDIDQNEKFLSEVIHGFKSQSFSYPYGECKPKHKKIIQRKYNFMRSIYPGINSGIFDASFLRANKLYNRTFSKKELLALLKATKENNGWVIFYTHDVSKDCSLFGCQPDQLNWLAEQAIELGLPIKTFKEMASLTSSIKGMP